MQVSNNVGRRILYELVDKNLSLTDLSKITGKAQFTLSVHLDNIVTEGLIAAHDDPDDSRRKVYKLVSVMLAHPKLPSDTAMTMGFDSLTDIADDPIKMHNMLSRFLFFGFDAMGLSVGPMASMLGFIDVMALGELLFGDTIEDTIGMPATTIRRWNSARPACFRSSL